VLCPTSATIPTYSLALRGAFFSVIELRRRTQEARMFINFSLSALIAIALIGVGYFADVWPKESCKSIPPYGPHDYECTYSVGR
jgi:hypothetical protein